MGYFGNEPAKVAVKVGTGVITAVELADDSITTADIIDDAITPNQLDDDATGFQVGSLGIGTAVSGSDLLKVGGSATLTGALSGTSATFSGDVVLTTGVVYTEQSAITFRNTGGSWKPINVQGINIGDWNTNPSYGDIMVGTYDFDVRKDDGSNLFSITNSNGNATFSGDLYCNDIYANGSSLLRLRTENGKGIEYLADADGHIFKTYSGGWQTRLTIADNGNATFSGNVAMTATGNKHIRRKMFHGPQLVTSGNTWAPISSFTVDVDSLQKWILIAWENNRPKDIIEIWIGSDSANQIEGSYNYIKNTFNTTTVSFSYSSQTVTGTITNGHGSLSMNYSLLLDTVYYF